jgi:hypothetical protein
MMKVRGLELAQPFYYHEVDRLEVPSIHHEKYEDKARTTEDTLERYKGIGLS